VLVNIIDIVLKRHRCGATIIADIEEITSILPFHSTAQHSTAQHSTAQHSTAQHSTAQHSTAQHSTAQHSTALGKFFRVVNQVKFNENLEKGNRNNLRNIHFLDFIFSDNSLFIRRENE